MQTTTAQELINKVDLFKDIIKPTRRQNNFLIIYVNQELKTKMKKAALILPKQCTQSPFSERTLEAV